MERDIRTNPYTPDEQRVCDYIQEITQGGIGCGDDPIGFIINHHKYIRSLLRDYRDTIRDLRDEKAKG